MLSVVWAKYQPSGLLTERQLGYPKMKVEERDSKWFVYDASNFFDYVRDTDQLSSYSWIIDFTDMEYETKQENQTLINSQSQQLLVFASHGSGPNSPIFQASPRMEQGK